MPALEGTSQAREAPEAYLGVARKVRCLRRMCWGSSSKRCGSLYLGRRPGSQRAAEMKMKSKARRKAIERMKGRIEGSYYLNGFNQKSYFIGDQHYECDRRNID